MRKEYIYRKSLQGKDAAIYEDKQRMREALRDGTPLPTELRSNEAILRHEVRGKYHHPRDAPVAVVARFRSGFSAQARKPLR